jgi:hypothetical protein
MTVYVFAYIVLTSASDISSVATAEFYWLMEEYLYAVSK